MILDTCLIWSDKLLLSPLSSSHTKKEAMNPAFVISNCYKDKEKGECAQYTIYTVWKCPCLAQYHVQ